MKHFKRQVLLTLLALSLCACTHPAATQTPRPSPVPASNQPAPSPQADAAGPPPCTQVGQTWRSPVDGATRVCVPAGEFLTGARDLRVTARASGQARHYFDGQMGFRCALNDRAP